MLKVVLSLTVLSLFIGCGGGSGSGGSNTTSQSLSYCYSENGCSTGTNTFSSQSAYCKALGEDSFNRGCAYDMRREAFNNDCSGYAWDSSDVTPQQAQTTQSMSCGN